MVSNKISTKILQDLVVSVKRGLSSYYLQKEGDEIPFINIGNIRDGGVDASTVSMIHVKDASALDKTKIEPNDIIISIKGSSFKTAIADESIKDFVISANLIAFKLNDEILPEIVVAYLNSPKGQGELQARSAGAVQKALNLKSLMETVIPVPSKDKQKVFAEYFVLSKQHNELMRKEQELRKKLNKSIMLNYLMG